MRRVLPFVLLPFLAVAPARAEESAGTRHAAWQSCLDVAFAEQARTASRSFAATKAVTTCREPEDAYLAALSTSPMMDGKDVARIRPALVARARERLIGLPRLSAL